MKMTVGERISTIRKKKKIKQVDLAKAVGLTVNGLQKIEYGDVQPKASTIHKIAKVLGVSDIELDDSLKEMVERWNEQNDVQSLEQEARLFDRLPPFTEDDIEAFHQFLLLSPDGKEKASEYIDFLMQKQEKK
ncbi:MAG: helix-turn-helix transcriptional regulator [Clostridia bacterium]|nr:helix-turn-helix transcriptional regulator [Clostridia bacterium]